MILDRLQEALQVVPFSVTAPALFDLSKGIRISVT